MQLICHVLIQMVALLAKHPAQSYTQQQGSTFATITNSVKVATLPLPVNMIMFASNRSAWEPTHNGSNSLLLLKTPVLNPHSTAELSPNSTLTSELSWRCLDQIVKCRD